MEKQEVKLGDRSIIRWANKLVYKLYRSQRGSMCTIRTQVKETAEEKEKEAEIKEFPKEAVSQ